MSQNRPPTAGEIALVRAAFGNKINVGRIKMTEGPGNEPLAHIAFGRGNRAITIKSHVYFRVDYSTDFSAPGKNRTNFIHEMAHVWQYQKLGLIGFAARYGAEFVKAKGKADDMYKYEAGKTPFNGAMLEAQSSMIEDYSGALWRGDAARLATLAKNLAGSGMYGL